jgi:hypothetical protein
MDQLLSPWGRQSQAPSLFKTIGSSIFMIAPEQNLLLFFSAAFENLVYVSLSLLARLSLLCCRRRESAQERDDLILCL